MLPLTVYTNGFSQASVGISVMIGATHLAFLAASLGPSRSASNVSGIPFMRIWYIWMKFFRPVQLGLGRVDLGLGLSTTNVHGHNSPDHDQNRQDQEEFKQGKAGLATTGQAAGAIDFAISHWSQTIFGGL